MNEISSTKEMSELLRIKGGSNVRFLARASIFLDDIGLNGEIIEELEEIARTARRSLHCHGYEGVSAKTGGIIFA